MDIPKESARFFFKDSEEAEDFCEYMCEMYGFDYQRKNNVVWTPEGVGYSQESMDRDVREFRGIPHE